MEYSIYKRPGEISISPDTKIKNQDADMNTGSSSFSTLPSKIVERGRVDTFVTDLHSQKKRDDEVGLTPKQIKILEREREWELSDEGLRLQDDLKKKDHIGTGPLRLVGQSLSSRRLKVHSWNPLITESTFVSLTPDEVGERERSRILALLQESGVANLLRTDQAVVLKRVEEIEDGPFTLITDIALHNEGLSALLRMAVKGQEGINLLYEKPIPVKDYPLYSELVDKAVQEFPRDNPKP